MTMFAIYSLVDPRDNLPFYVGITDDVYARFQQHLRCDGSNFRRDERIRELKALNLMVVMPTLQTVPTIDQARIREAYWIYHYIQLGIVLCNNTIPAPFEYMPIQKRAHVLRTKRDTEANMLLAFNECKSDQVAALRSKGFGKCAIIEKVWSCKRGGSQKWKAAESEYDAIIQTESEAQ